MNATFIAEFLAGQVPGSTFNFDGSPFDWRGDVVTLTSVNIFFTPGAQPNPHWLELELEEFIATYRHAELPQICYGLYRLADGKISIDLNVCVEQAHRDNTLRFAQANGQEAIWDARKGECVYTHGDGISRLTAYGDVVEAALKLTRGQPVIFDL